MIFFKFQRRIISLLSKKSNYSWSETTLLVLLSYDGIYLEMDGSWSQIKILWIHQNLFLDRISFLVLIPKGKWIMEMTYWNPDHWMKFFLNIVMDILCIVLYYHRVSSCLSNIFKENDSEYCYLNWHKSWSATTLSLWYES